VGQTDDSGLITFQNMAAGTYRLRFEHEGFYTLEKEVNLPTGKPLRVTATLSPAPPPPPPPKPEPPPAPPAPVPDGNYQPSSLSIPDFYEKTSIGPAPVKIGCGAHATSTLVQPKESLAEHTHADADEVIYVVAGEGTHRIAGRETPLKAGSYAFIPSGTPHSVLRRGSRPILFVSTLSGPPCNASAK
jgi:mannose-6-phosphate isomerase-like protein (cupin superfamily)